MNFEQSPVAARWAEIESELDNIQRHIRTEEKSVRRRVAEWGAFFALLVSLAVGGFTIYDNLFLGPEQRRSDDLSRLHDLILQIGRANLDSLSAANSGDFNQSNFYLRQANSIKLPLMFHAVEIVENNPDHVSVPSLMSLIPELWSAQEYDRAIELGNIARQKADKRNSTPFFVEATRYVANAYMGKATLRDRETARELYAEAISRAKTLKSINQAWIISNTLSDWAAMEAMFADCPQSLAVFDRLFDDIEHPIGRAAICFGAWGVVRQVDSYRTCKVEEFQSIVESSGLCSS